MLKELKKAKTLDELVRKTPDDVDADRIINVGVTMTWCCWVM